MSSTDRQNNLLVSENWQKIYQSFKNADFQSYDFDNLRRTMIDYIRTNFPEDFNDYIESSEYLALIDLIAFIGQSVAFRVDLNARENFLELAERRESVLRLARMISYNATRSVPASGLLKVNTVQTTDTVLDSNGINLSGQVVTWNDSSNSNWYDQFIRTINAALPPSQQVGTPLDQAKIYGIPTSQYRFNSSNTNIPTYSFSSFISGYSMNFEVTSTTFSGKNYIYEESPKLGNHIACVFRDDGYGAGSPTTGFFFNFTQGTLNQSTFNISQPTSNQTININSQNINNTDVWLWQLDQNTNLENTLWTQVPALTGSNVIYNSLNLNIQTIYNVVTRAGDTIALGFADGTFGKLPLGNFRVYYRLSNGLAYSINPSDIVNVSIDIPYVNSQGQNHVLTLTLNLATSVTNAVASETNASIQQNAPQSYYTQNRMITGEDYNISPLTTTQSVAKVKALNRTSSGISRYFDLVDPTGKYSKTNLFGDDGVIYQEPYALTTKFSYVTQADIEGVIYNKIFQILENPNLRNFYYANYINRLSESLSVSWTMVTKDSNSSTGFIKNIGDSVVVKLGPFTSTDLVYFTAGTLIKFEAPKGQYFNTNKNNLLVTSTTALPGYVSYIWAQVVSVSGDGTAGGTGILTTGYGAIILNQIVPTGSIVTQAVPQLITIIPSPVITTMIDLIFSNAPFGLSYNSVVKTWQIVFETNLNTIDSFSLSNQGSTSNSQQDSSWMLLFTTNNVNYTVTTRLLRYVFESDQEVTFYFDSTVPVYDTVSGTTILDTLKLLSINTQPKSVYPFTTDLDWQIISDYVGLDGYTDPTKIVVSFASSTNNGIVDNPQLFLDLVSPDNLTTFVVQQKYLISSGQEDYQYVSNDNDLVIIVPTQSAIGSLTQYVNGQYFYCIDTQTSLKYVAATSKLNPTLDVQVYIGRDKLKFQYTHNADYDSRIDPGASNIMDVYILTTSYDTSFRKWVLAGALNDGSEPLPPSSAELNSLLSASLNPIKAMSDEIIYHPVNYLLLFGAQADQNLQATFNVVKNPNSTASVNEIKSGALLAINTFFELQNWDFGDTFYFAELATYVLTRMTPDISNFVIVPVQENLYFGSLFEIRCPSDQILISCATAENINVVTGLTSDNIRTVTGQGLISPMINQNTTSATFGASS
jgi:hypothetical protein